MAHPLPTPVTGIPGLQQTVVMTRELPGSAEVSVMEGNV